MKYLSFIYTWIPLITLLINLGALEMSYAKKTDKDIEIERILNSNSKVSISSAIFKDGRLVQSHVLGRAVKNQNDVFHIGSNTKVFTAVAILKLVESKKLKLTDRVSQYFPDFKRQYRDLKVANLLNHSSGIPELFELSYMAFFQDLEPDLTLKLLQGTRPKFKPGKKNEYSNGNYIILGKIIEKVTGGSYFDFLEKEIFRAIGIKNTFHCSKSPSRIVESYIWLQSFSIPVVKKMSIATAFAAGDLCSTAEDLAKFFDAIFNEKIISRDYVHQLTQFSYPKEGKKVGFGYGVFNYFFSGKSFYGHTGDFGSYRTLSVFNPKLKYSKSVVTNIDLPRELLDYMGSAIPDKL